MANLRYIFLLSLFFPCLGGGCGLQDPDYHNYEGVSLNSQGRIDDAIKEYKSRHASVIARAIARSNLPITVIPSKARNLMGLLRSL